MDQLVSTERREERGEIVLIMSVGNKSGADSPNYFTEKNSLSPRSGQTSAPANHLIQDRIIYVLAGVRKIYGSQLSDRFSEIW